MKPLILGEAPSKSGDRYWRFPLSGQVGKRLCTFAGIAPLERDSSMTSDYARYYWALREQFNLDDFFERYADIDWSVETTDQKIRMAIPVLTGRTVVLCGVRLQQAFARQRIGSRGFFEWTLHKGLNLRVATIPHPSALNRMYADKAVQDLAGRTLREAIEYAKMPQRPGKASPNVP